MSTFEFTVLGASGGPSEGGTQSMLLREHGTLGSEKWICVDAGSGLHQLMSMLAKKQRLAANERDSCMGDRIESLYRNMEEPLSAFIDRRLHVLRGLNSSELLVSEDNIICAALKMFNKIREYYITHPHLDHVAALVINSPAVKAEGKTILGLKSTVDALKEHLFNDVIWPDLLAEKSTPLDFNVLRELKVHKCVSVPNWSILPFPVSHGQTVVGRVPNFSTVYLIKDQRTDNCLLVCGDLESDLISGKPYLSNVWNYLSENIPFNRITGIVMECSSPSSTEKAHLYGHMSSRYVVHELKQLSKAYDRPLDGLKVIIIHVKMEPQEIDPRLTILEELRSLASMAGIGDIIFSIAIQGYTFIL
ncbi:LAFE_0F17942g1_1 [Lachancea fermentati]|uniref:LAFE_0F17942g1_1 n=1 Tax=Lachancea fermentati TaxID=4955 RepID=A0A1G4MGC0_LACFM|nr:LAFE_0F17942g1_1 [Lachancea fermentati]